MPSQDSGYQLWPRLTVVVNVPKSSRFDFSCCYLRLGVSLTTIGVDVKVVRLKQKSLNAADTSRSNQLREPKLGAHLWSKKVRAFNRTLPECQSALWGKRSNNHKNHVPCSVFQVVNRNHPTLTTSCLISVQLNSETQQRTN